MKRNLTQKELIAGFFNKLDQIYEKRLSNLEVLANNNDEIMAQIKSQLKRMNKTLGSIQGLYQTKIPVQELNKTTNFKDFFDIIVQNSKISSNNRSFSKESIEKTQKNHHFKPFSTKINEKTFKKPSDFKILHKKPNFTNKTHEISINSRSQPSTETTVKGLLHRNESNEFAEEKARNFPPAQSNYTDFLASEDDIL